MAPKINSHLPYRLCGIFVTITLIITLVLVAVINCYWNYQEWESVPKGSTVRWDVTLFNIEAKSNCVQNAKVPFNVYCTQLFQKTSGPIDSVAEKICSWSVSGAVPSQVLNGDSIAYTDLENSCDAMRNLSTFSLVTFIICVISPCLLLTSFLALLKWCYVSFAMTRKSWYYVSVISMGCSFLLLLTACTIYYFLVGDMAHILRYENILTSYGFKTMYGWGLYLSFIAAMLHLVLFGMFAGWVPRGLDLDGADDYATYKKLRGKKGKGKKKKNKKTPAMPTNTVPVAEYREDEEAAQPLIPQTWPSESRAVYPGYEPATISPGYSTPVSYASSYSEPPKKVFWAFMPEVFGDEDFIDETQALEDHSFFMPQQQQVVTTGYETVTTTYVGVPITTDDGAPPENTVVHNYYPPVSETQVISQEIIHTGDSTQDLSPTNVVSGGYQPVQVIQDANGGGPASIPYYYYN